MELVGGQLLDVTGYTTEERADYEARPDDPGRWDWTGVRSS
ncbi:hypothetical protein [Streptomyces griseus]